VGPMGSRGSSDELNARRPEHGVMEQRIMNPPTGVLPDEVVRDPRSQAVLAFVGLDTSLSSDAAQAFLRELTSMLRSLASDGTEPDFTSVVAFGSSFFSQASSPRFGLTADAMPLGLRVPPVLTGISPPPMPSDLLIYAMSRRQALVAELLRFLTGQPAVKQLRVEQGYQRRDHREQFGFLDGLRNLPSRDRPAVITTTVEIEPDGPPWAIGGTYMTYIKIQQNLDAPAGSGGTTFMEGIIGRRQDDGARLDQPEHMNPVDEPDFGSVTVPTQTSHVRKAGPRGDEQHEAGDAFLFRRGIPFTDVVNSQLSAGLHFVSFSRSLDLVDVVWNHWIMNPDFPVPSTGTDQLFASTLTSFLASGFFFVPPDDSRFVGAGIFAGPETGLDSEAKVVVRKVILGPDGSPVLRSRKGFGFTVFDPSTNTAVAAEFKTNSVGHAVSPDLPTGKPLILRETTNPLAAQGVQGLDIPFGPLDTAKPPAAVTFANKFPSPPPPSPYHP
jgi:Dyp-type peroxidase family